LVYLFFYKLEEQDKFILSKGHAAAALYTILAKSGKLPEDALDSFYKDGTLLAAHPPCSGKLPAIPFGTGSLGHGLSLATGMALSARYTGQSLQVYCILSDGDCNEGSTWEAVMFAAHHKLSNLTVIIDYNKIQGFGRTDDVLNMEPMEQKWSSFNFNTVLLENGHDFDAIHSAFLAAQKSDKPTCIIAKTIKGKGVSFMEDTIEWHYLPMNESQFLLALHEAGGSDA
jgi:transketolase